MSRPNNKIAFDHSDLHVTRVDINNVGYYACGYKNTKTVLAITGLIGDGDDEQSVANARRIVACISACAGIETEVLELFIDRMNASPKKQNLTDIANTDINALSEGDKANAISVASSAIQKAREASRRV